MADRLTATQSCPACGGSLAESPHVCFDGPPPEQPDGWQVQKTFGITHTEVGLVGIAFVGQRIACSCSAFSGMRADNQEMVFLATGCPLHSADGERAMATFKEMPGQDEDVFVLWARTLEEEIELGHCKRCGGKLEGVVHVCSPLEI